MSCPTTIMATTTDAPTTTITDDEHPKDPAKYTTLTLSSGNGPLTIPLLLSPPRDALLSEIPIISLAALSHLSPSPQDLQHIATQIRSAATTSGFFYISDTGIPSSITSAAYSSVLKFFRQPLETKNLANVSHSAYFNGYKAAGSQRINASESIDVRETFSWTYDPNYDPAVTSLSNIPAEVMDMLRPEEFPWDATANLPELKRDVVAYWRACLSLARRLVGVFEMALGVEKGELEGKFSHPDAALALNYYPPIPFPEPRLANEAETPTGTQEEQEQVSIGSHTDFQLFTILWQDTIGGLQVLHPQDHQWLHAPPLPDTFVVNFGDFMQRITNGRWKSTVHRAQNFSGQERVSMPFFFGFNRNERMGVLEGCVEEGVDWVGEGGRGRRYAEVGCDEWVRRRVGGMHRMDEEGGRGQGREEEGV